jgi:hypothetical protein
VASEGNQGAPDKTIMRRGAPPHPIGPFAHLLCRTASASQGDGQRKVRHRPAYVCPNGTRGIESCEGSRSEAEGRGRLRRRSVRTTKHWTRRKSAATSRGEPAFSSLTSGRCGALHRASRWESVPLLPRSAQLDVKAQARCERVLFLPRFTHLEDKPAAHCERWCFTSRRPLIRC